MDAPTVQPGPQSVSEAIPGSGAPACVEMASDCAPGAPDNKALGLPEAGFQLSVWDVLSFASTPASRDGVPEPTQGSAVEIRGARGTT